MPTRRSGKVYRQLALEEHSEVNRDLEAYARKRSISVTQAARCILADWSDAIRGKPNPFAVNVSYVPSQNGQEATTAEPEETAEERARRLALLEAAKQFL